MGRSSDMAIAEANRNEAKEAMEAIKKLHSEMDEQFLQNENDGTAKLIQNWQSQLVQINYLIRKFKDKHQPDVQRFK